MVMWEVMMMVIVAGKYGGQGRSRESNGQACPSLKRFRFTLNVNIASNAAITSGNSAQTGGRSRGSLLIG